MNDEALIVAICERLREAFNRPTLTFDPDTMMRDILGFDSVQFIMMILALESEFGVHLHEDEVDSIYSMGDVFELLRRKVPVEA